MNCIASNETCPIIGVGTTLGTVLIMEIDDQATANVAAKYYLTSSKIIHMKLIPNSSSFIVLDDENSFFLINRQTNTNKDIKKFIDLSYTCLDHSIIEINGTINMLMLYVKCGKNDIDASMCLCDYTTIETSSNHLHQMQTIQMSASYCAMQFQYYDTNKFVLASRMIDIDLLQLTSNENGKIELNLLQTIVTSHLFGMIQFTVNAASVLTYGSDGQILLWDKNSMRMVKSVYAHDKCCHGVKNAVLDSMQR